MAVVVIAYNSYDHQHNFCKYVKGQLHIRIIAFQSQLHIRIIALNRDVAALTHN